jgi:hypothetical protein
VTEITVIYLGRQPDPVIAAGQHVHMCPVCYRFVGCEYACSCPDDLIREDGAPCGSVATCAFCEAEDDGHGA